MGIKDYIDDWRGKDRTIAELIKDRNWCTVACSIAGFKDHYTKLKDGLQHCEATTSDSDALYDCVADVVAALVDNDQDLKACFEPIKKFVELKASEQSKNYGTNKIHTGAIGIVATYYTADLEQ